MTPDVKEYSFHDGALIKAKLDPDVCAHYVGPHIYKICGDPEKAYLAHVYLNELFKDYEAGLLETVRVENHPGDDMLLPCQYFYISATELHRWVPMTFSDEYFNKHQSGTDVRIDNSNINLINVLKDIILRTGREEGIPPIRTQKELIAYITNKYKNIKGLSRKTLENRFSQSNKISVQLK